MEQSLTRYDLCKIAEQVISKEFAVQDFTKLRVESEEYNRARYLYVWFLFNNINASQIMIRKMMWPAYGYRKTVYQVIRRMYQRRRENEIKSDLDAINYLFRQEVNRYEVKNIKPRKDGKQLKLFN